MNAGKGPSYVNLFFKIYFTVYSAWFGLELCIFCKQFFLYFVNPDLFIFLNQIGQVVFSYMFMVFFTT